MDDLEPRGEPRPAPASAAPPDEPTRRSNRRRRWFLAVLLILLALGGAFAGLVRRPHNTAIQPTPAVQVTPTDTDAPFPSNTASETALPDPLAVRYQRLLPRARLAAVLAARER
ncbi:MAG TPA: hypothetical protein VNA20_10025 [Frankiaceae bacterium]|nr:hypothetical protein [Frankiaceae bacterium]